MNLRLKQELEYYNMSSPNIPKCKGCGADLSSELKCTYCGNEYVDVHKKETTVSNFDIAVARRNAYRYEQGVDFFCYRKMGKIYRLSFSKIKPGSIRLYSNNQCFAIDDSKGNIMSDILKATVNYETGAIIFIKEKDFLKDQSIKIVYLYESPLFSYGIY